MSISKNVHYRRKVFVASAGLVFYGLFAVEATYAVEATDAVEAAVAVEAKTMQEEDDYSMTAAEEAVPPPAESKDFVVQGDDKSLEQQPGKISASVEKVSKPDSQ